MLQMTRPLVVTPPATEPISLSQAKKQLEIPTSDTAHDDQLTLLIQAAREQWEHDTDTAVITQALRVFADRFDSDEVYIPRRPIQSITSVKYFDSLNVQQTLPADVYNLNSSKRTIELAYLKLWPMTLERWDAIEITFVAGFTNAAAVPAIAKQAMLLLVGYYFENRDMIGSMVTEVKAYENLVCRYQRASYP